MNRKLKVLQVIQNFEVGGLQNFVYDLVNTPQFIIFINDVICLDRNSGYSEDKFRGLFNRTYQHKMIYKSISRKPYRLWKFIRTIRMEIIGSAYSATIKKISPDIIHSHVTTGLKYQLMAAKNNSIPIIISFHATKKLSRSDETYLSQYRHRHLITCDSTNTWISSIPFYDDVDIIPTGIKMNSKPVISKKDARSKLGIPHDKFVLGSIGRLNHVKGFDILIEAVKNLNSDNNSLLFVVAGQGNEKNELERRVIEYNLQDKIKFIGFLENTEDLLAALDVFLLTSRSEGFPLSLLEAMNFKLPTIATDVGGIRDLLVDGKAGLIIPPENKFELVKAIRILFENPNLLSQYSELSYNRSLDFSIETCAGLYLKKYQDLLEQ